MKKIATDHGARPTFARLAMDHGDVFGVLRQPLLDVAAERLYQFDFWRVVVVERKTLYSVVELGFVVVAFRTQVVDEVVVVVLRVKELDDVVDVVPIDSFDVRSWVTHGDDVVSYV